MSFLAEYAEDEVKAQRSVSSIIITELLHSIINENTCEMELGLIAKSLNRKIEGDVSEATEITGKALLNYKAKLVSILKADRWFDIYTSRVRQDIIDYMFARVKEHHQPLNVRLESTHDSDGYIKEQQMKALEAMFDSTEEKNFNQDYICTKIDELKELYQKLPFQ